MTPVETISLTSEQIKMLSDEQISKLPTIIDVLAYISASENVSMRQNLQQPGLHLLYCEGIYAVMSDKAWTNIPKLYPCSQTPFTLMRGENAYHPDCRPSLYRTPKGMTAEDYWLISRLRACEFIAIIHNHPVVNEIKQHFMVEYMAIAQHYGFPTEYLDLTNQKWVAAFFACTKTDTEGNYIPVQPDEKNKVGVLYMSKPEHSHGYPANLKALGFHYFERPTRQNAMVYEMQKGDNFDTDPFFHRIVFRHDAEANGLVYKMAYNQLRYFPKDPWADIAEQIRLSDYPISQAAIDESRKYGVTLPDTELLDALSRYHIPFNPYSMPKAMPNAQQMEWELQKWYSYISPYLDHRKVYLPPVYKL